MRVCMKKKTKHLPVIGNEGESFLTAVYKDDLNLAIGVKGSESKQCTQTDSTSFPVRGKIIDRQVRPTCVKNIKKHGGINLL